MRNWRARAVTFFRGGLFRNIISLYGVQASHQILQLLTIPFLARILGPTEWGRLAEAQSVTWFVQLLVNYGFSFAATREVARWRDDPQRISGVVSNTIGAQSLLAIFVAAATVLFTRFWMPHLYADPRLLGATIVAGLLTGMMPMWYFQGHERMGRVASLDMTGKILTAVGLFIMIRSPQDGWKMLAMQALSAGVVFTVAYREIFGLHTVRTPSPARIIEAFKEGWDMFLFSSASSLLGIGNVLLLGLMAPPNIVGFYAGAEKLGRAFVGFLWPFNQAIFPRVNHLCHTDPPAGARLVLRSLVVMGGAGLLMGGVAYVFAPQVIRLILGPGFEPAIPAMRIIALMVVVLPLNIVFGVQWSVPMGLDRAYGRAILLALVVNASLASVLAPRYGHIGMAISVTFTECFVLASIWWLLWKKRLNPFRIARQASPSEDVVERPLPLANQP